MTKLWRRVRPALVTTTIVALVLVVAVPPALVAISAFNRGPVIILQSVLRGNDTAQRWTPLDHISSHLSHAVIAAEDGKFCAHHGFDWDAIQSAWQFNKSGNGKRGASTISMQTAKNVFLWPQRSWTRKAFEAYFTVLIELMWTKQQIMEAYLNVAEWGVQVYGAEAAAQHHFGKSSRWLSRTESARLAAILPSPLKWKANPAGRYVVQRSGVLLRRMEVVANGHANCLQ